MKTIKIHLKAVAFFLSALMLLQGCTVYKSANVTLDQAVQNESKVKVITKSNEKFKLNRIEIEDGNYYGIVKNFDENEKFILDKNSIKLIKEKDKTLSTVLSIAIPVVFIIGMVAISYSPGPYDLGWSQ